jgi:flagellar basal-body rod protein FlgG
MLIGALYTSDSGVLAASSYLDVTGNNIANSNTVGFKTSQVTFQDLLYTGLAPGATAAGVTPPGGIQIGQGTTVASTSPLFTQGGLTASSGQFDLAISAQGFFAVTRPDGTTAYTRAGNFTFNSAGQIVASDGSILVGGITVPSGATAVSVSPGGQVTATAADGTTLQLGQLQITEFTNPDGLTRIGDTMFAASPASGTAVTGDPGTSGLGTLSQGYLEQSNVSLSTELVNLIIAQQTFDYNTQAIQIENETLQTTTSLIS